MAKSKSETKREDTQVKFSKAKKPSAIYQAFLLTLSSGERSVAMTDPNHMAPAFKKFIENMDAVKLLELVK